LLYHIMTTEYIGTFDIF